MDWRARLRNGLVQYSAIRPPTALQATRQLLGLDGGDWRSALSSGHPDRPVDGGDFDTGALVTLPMAQIAEGGDFGMTPGEIIDLAGNGFSMYLYWDETTGSNTWSY